MFQIDQTKASIKNAENDAPSMCAACGKSAFDLMMEDPTTGLSVDQNNTKKALKRCTACYSVRYCGISCQKSHRKSHKKECKETANKRRAFNAKLFELEMDECVPVPPPPRDCDLCMYRMPPGAGRSKYFGCCGKIICKACFSRSLSDGDILSTLGKFGSMNESNPMERMQYLMDTFGPNGQFSAEKRDEQNGCPFCRSTEDMVVFNKKHQKRREDCLLARANKSDSRALFELACIHLVGCPKEITLLKDYDDIQTLPQDEQKAIEYFEKSAALGNCDAFYELARRHRREYNAADFFTCLVKAADLGSTLARDHLASLAMEKKQTKVAMEHYKLLAVAGYNQTAIDMLTDGYKNGLITREELASSLRTYQSAREELASEDRVRLDLMGMCLSSDGKIAHPDMYR